MKAKTWIEACGGRLLVVPSIHYRQASAQAVLECLAACGDVDVIAVELPANWRPLALRMVALLPAPAVAVVAAEPGRGRHPALLPVTPVDSIMVAIWAALRMPRAGRGPELAFIDIESPDRAGGKPGPVRRRPDDWEPQLRGNLEEFLERLPLTEGRDPVDARRERAMAFRLRVMLDAGRRVLFVCGAAHWKPVLALLQGPRSSPPGPPAVAKACPGLRVHPVTAVSAWKQGWLDDAPALASAWCRALLAGNAADFDKLRAVEEVFGAAVAKGLAEGAVTIRSLAAFRRLLEMRLAAEARWIPEIRLLFGCAKACFGGSTLGMPRLLTEEWLRFDHEHPQAQRLFSERTTGGGRLVAAGSGAGKALGVVPDDGTEVALPPDLACLIPEEFPARELGPGNAADRQPPLFGGTTPAAADQQLKRNLHRRIHALARGVIEGHPPRPPAETVPFRPGGDLGQGLDVRATLRRRIRGDGGLMIRRQGRPCPADPPPDGAAPAPIVFIHRDLPANRCSTTSGAFRLRDRAGTAYASFYWFSDRTRLLIRGRGTIVRSRVAVCVRLLYEDSTAPDAGYAVPPSGPYCQTSPWNDGDLARLSASPASLAIACAVKHVAPGRHICVVACPGFELDAAVRDFAASRRVRIASLPAALFPPGMLQRSALDFECPTAPGTSFRAAEWTRSFVPPAF